MPASPACSGMIPTPRNRHSEEASPPSPKPRTPGEGGPLRVVHLSRHKLARTLAPAPRRLLRVQHPAHLCSHVAALKPVDCLRDNEKDLIDCLSLLENVLEPLHPPPAVSPAFSSASKAPHTW